MRLRQLGMLAGMDPQESVVTCSSCGALYTPGPGDRGICLDCRRRAAAAQPRPPSGITARPTAVTPPRPTSPPRPAALSALRPNYALRRNLVRLGISVAMAGGLTAGAVTQRQRITTTWHQVQRHGISKEWTTIQRKAHELWVAVRRDTPWPVVEDRRSASGTASSTTRGTHHHTQVAATSTKRKGKKRGYEMGSAGSTP